MSKKPRFMSAGERNNRLVAVARVDSLRWLFKCDCGNDHIANVGGVRYGNTKSCGCLNRERWVEFNRRTKRKHGMRGSPEYQAWIGMKARCSNKTIPHYGSRGIEVHPKWKQDFTAFYAYVGPRPSPGHSLDRINVNRGYVPGNIRWATRSQQQSNKTTTRLLKVGRKLMTPTEAAKATGISVHAIFARIKYGWDAKRIVSTPTRAHKRSAK